jgi:hypothetical protein
VIRGRTCGPDLLLAGALPRRDALVDRFRSRCLEVTTSRDRDVFT